MEQSNPPALVRLSEGLGAWLPIATAPRGMDNYFLGWDGVMVDKTWEGWSDSDTGDVGESKPVYVRADWISWEPTYWMPLPAPPASA